MAICMHIFRDHTVYGFSKWEATLQCNVISHWLCPYPECCLISVYCVVDNDYHTTLPRDGWYILWCPCMFRFQVPGLCAITSYVARANTDSRSYVTIMATISYLNLRKKNQSQNTGAYWPPIEVCHSSPLNLFPMEKWSYRRCFKIEVA